MSLAAMVWAIEEAPVITQAERLVLLALADGARTDGTGACPGNSTIAERAMCSKRTVQYTLRALEDAGLIRLGDQGVAARYGRYAPTVYDLAIGGEFTKDLRGAESAPLEIAPDPEPDPEHEPDLRGATRGATEPVLGVHAAAPEPSTQSRAESNSLSPDQVLVGRLLGLPGDDERLEAVPKMLADNKVQNPRGWIRSLSVTGDLGDCLDMAHASLAARGRFDDQVESRRCPHGKVNGHITCPDCTDAMVGS